jgi:hypothetical protein
MTQKVKQEALSLFSVMTIASVMPLLAKTATSNIDVLAIVLIVTVYIDHSFYVPFTGHPNIKAVEI